MPDCTRYLEQLRTTIALSGRLTVDDVDALGPSARDELLAAFHSVPILTSSARSGQAGVLGRGRDRHAEGPAPHEHGPPAADVADARWDLVVLGALVPAQRVQLGAVTGADGVGCRDDDDAVVGPGLDVDVLERDDERAVGLAEDRNTAGGVVVDADELAGRHAHRRRRGVRRHGCGRTRRGGGVGRALAGCSLATSGNVSTTLVSRSVGRTNTVTATTAPTVRIAARTNTLRTRRGRTTNDSSTQVPSSTALTTTARALITPERTALGCVDEHQAHAAEEDHLGDREDEQVAPAVVGRPAGDGLAVVALVVPVGVLPGVDVTVGSAMDLPSAERAWCFSPGRGSPGRCRRTRARRRGRRRDRR